MKTGLHLHGAGQRARIIDYYRRSGSRVVKFMNFRDIGLMQELKAMGVTIIYRQHTDDQKLGGASAEKFMRDLIASVRGTPVDYAEGYNEAFGDRGEIGRYAAFEIDRMKALEAIGKKAIIGNFSLGTPEITDGGKTWEEFRPALRHADANGHALGLHEYAGPYMQYYTKTPDGRNQWKNNVFTGVSPDPAVYWNPTLTGWVTLRYRDVYALFRTWGLGNLPLYITEGGIDDSSPRPGPNGRGYKDFQRGGWDALPGIGDYAEQRRWYMWQASHDTYLKGVVDFGWQGTSTGWAAFDLETDPGMVERIIAREADLPVGHYGDTPTPPTPPEAPMLQGIDVSHWQGTVDWRKAASAGAVYAWLKATDGSTYVDPEYARNAAGARDAGLLHGPYHYFRNSIDPILQAEHFARVVKAGPEPTLPVALDFEDTTGEINAVNMRRFVERVNALLGRPIIYTGAWFWTPARLGGTQEWAKLFPLWIADYDGSVSIPSDWRDWTVHQYTSSGDGIAFGADSARIDRNRYRGTREELAALRIPPPAPPSSIDVAKLWVQAAANQAIRLNPAAGLQRAILAAGLEVVSNEWDYDEAHVAQLGQGAAAGGKQAVYVYDKGTGRITRHNQP